jgi:hypothetical protein
MAELSYRQNQHSSDVFTLLKPRSWQRIVESDGGCAGKASAKAKTASIAGKARNAMHLEPSLSEAEFVKF